MSTSTTSTSTEGFESDWLTLRRDADARARTESTKALLSAVALPGAQKRLSPLDIVDLGSGSGSNALYLMPNLAAAGIHHQRWVLVDSDPDLLDEAMAEIEEETHRVSDAISARLEIETVTCCLDMSTDMDDVPIKGAQLVTSSALLDLVSGHWVTDLSSRLEHFRVGAALMTLVVDGHVEWSPMEPRHDREIMAAFQRDMRRDKGFGPALGADAITTYGRAMVARGNTVQCFDASWILDDLDTELQERYLDDVTKALRGTDVDGALLDEWYERRRRWIDTDESDLVVGHYDILALRAPV
ncbi:hypothetical protein Poly30_46390 [Planctomycetes bacterium Poly30]|uniref:Methyltransferase domain protein n=1 Tax=Saltatorellus ferox TaxID=2528018 RepID=A0A518EYD3_9BACT|nr:hypothetical protein Poly30_46390 [Planctomycetes bacterium Poly30]